MGKKARARERQRKHQAAAPEPVAALADDAQPPADGVGVSPSAATADAEADTSQLATRLDSAAIHLLRSLQREDRAGVSAARLSALSVLVFGGPRSLGELAEAQGVRPPSMTRMVTAMEADALVARTRDTSDGRRVVIRATPAGERLMHEGRDQRTAVLAGWLRELGPDRLGTLSRGADVLDDLLSRMRAR